MQLFQNSNVLVLLLLLAEVGHYSVLPVLAAPQAAPAVANGGQQAATAAAGTPNTGATKGNQNYGVESGHQLVADGLSIDIVAAEAAARPAAELPSQYAVRGVIDPQSPLFSEDPGVLVPLAQSKSPVGDWLAAVDAAGPGTPLSDPMFVGTVFIPSNEAFEERYPELRLLKLQGKPVESGFSNSSTFSLALQLNCLTVPGVGLKVGELTPGRLLRTAGFGAIKAISSSTADKAARLQHLPSGVYFSITEPDLQSGNAVAHVIDVLPPASLLNKVAVTSRGSSSSPSSWQYSSVMMALMDPVRKLQSFAWLVQRAEAEGRIMTQLLDSSTDAFTLFAPNEQAMAALMASLPGPVRQRLLTDASLADQFVSSHLVLGTALGSKALEALLPSGQIKTPQGGLAVTATTEDRLDVKGLGNAVAIIEAGRQQPAAEPAQTTPAAVEPSAAAVAAADAEAGAHAEADADTEAPAAAWDPLQPDYSWDPVLNPGAPPAPPTAPTPAPAPAPPSAPSTTTGAEGKRNGSLSTPAAPTAPAAGAVGADVGAPIAALSRNQVLSVAGAAVVAQDMVGGKAVLHVVDRVLISPELSEALGLPVNQGYSMLDTPVAAAANSATGRSQQGRLLAVALSSALTAAVLLVWL